MQQHNSIDVIQRRLRNTQLHIVSEYEIFYPLPYWQHLFFAPVPFHLFYCGEISHKSQTGSISPWATEPFVRKTKCCSVRTIVSHCQTVSCSQTHSLTHSYTSTCYFPHQTQMIILFCSLTASVSSPPGLLHVFLSNASNSLSFSGGSLYFLTAGQIFSTYLNDGDVLHLHRALPITWHRSERLERQAWAHGDVGRNNFSVTCTAGTLHSQI